MFPFDNTYARLPDRFYARVNPTKVRAPRIIKVNRALADQLVLEQRRRHVLEHRFAMTGSAVELATGFHVTHK